MFNSHFSKKIKKNLARLVVACLAVGMPMTAMTPAKADASVLGSVIAAGIQAYSTNAQLKQLDSTEEGRKAVMNQLQSNYAPANNEALNQRAGSIIANLTAAIAEVDPSINDKPYEYYVNDQTTFNAACTLGHNITINAGIFDLLTTDDEIAVVVGHEMGHGQKNHVLKSYQESIPATLIGTAVAAGGSAVTGSLAGLAVNYIDKVHISKPKEWEADKLSFEYMSHTDYNLGATAAVWQKVIEQYGDSNSSSFGNIFSPSDHPGHAERRDAYAEQLKEYSNDVISVADGTVSIRGEVLVAPAASSTMSGAERSYFVAGNLARYYHEKTKDIPTATIQGSTVYVENQAIMTCLDGDPTPEELAERFNGMCNPKD